MTDTFSETAPKAEVPKFLASLAKKYHAANNPEINNMVIPIKIFLPIKLRYLWFKIRYVNIVFNSKQLTYRNLISAASTNLYNLSERRSFVATGIEHNSPF